MLSGRQGLLCCCCRVLGLPLGFGLALENCSSLRGLVSFLVCHHRSLDPDPALDPSLQTSVLMMWLRFLGRGRVELATFRMFEAVKGGIVPLLVEEETDYTDLVRGTDYNQGEGNHL